MIIVLTVLTSILIGKLKQQKGAAKRRQEPNFTGLRTTSRLNHPANSAAGTEVGYLPPIQPGNPTYDDIGGRSAQYESVHSGERTVNSYETPFRHHRTREHVYVKPRARI